MEMTDEITKHGDIGTPERHTRGELETKIVEGQPRTSVRKISPLDYYYNREQLDSAQLAAGKKLYQCYVTAHVGFNDSSPKERIQGGLKHMEITEKQVHAAREYDKGREAAGLYWDIVDIVCLRERFISSLGKDWRNRKSIKERLLQGLDKVAVAYGFN